MSVMTAQSSISVSELSVFSLLECRVLNNLVLIEHYPGYPGVFRRPGLDSYDVALQDNNYFFKSTILFLEGLSFLWVLVVMAISVIDVLQSALCVHHMPDLSNLSLYKALYF